MKSILNAIAIVALGAGFASCSGFLDEKMTTSYAGDNMISTKSALDANAIGCYANTKGVLICNANHQETFAPGSAVYHWGLGYSTAIKNAQERWTSCLKFTRFSQHPQGWDTFRNTYKTIYRCNALIRSVANSPVDAEYKKHIEGEAYFLRAFNYFCLVRMYGDIPLITEAPLGISEVYKPRENFWVVYNQIVKDLETAEGLLDDFATMNGKYGNSAGRVCNYAATAMKASVYLTIGTLLAHPDDNFWLAEKRTPDFSEIGINSAGDAFTKALAAAEDVINNGPFELEKSFQKLFRWTEPEDFQSKERIFVTPITVEGGGVNMATWTLPQYYNNKAKGNGGRMRPTRWLFQKWAETYPEGADKGAAGATNADIYINCKDPRFDVTFIYGSYVGQNNANKVCYPDKATVKAKSNDATRAFPYYKKNYDPKWNGNSGYADIYIMRFAEVYLIAAEAAANLATSVSDANGTKALGYVNVILDRARKSTTMDGTGTPSVEPKDWTSSKFATKDELLTAIFWERCFEMSDEQHEWYDIHRMGAKWIVENISKPKNAFLALPEQQDLTFGANGFHYYWYGEGFKYDEDWTLVRKGLICGFPEQELVYNTELDVTLKDPNRGQNPDEVFWR